PGGRRIRGRGAVRHAAGGVVQAHGPAHPAHVAAPSPFRADRLARVPRRAALLHRRGAARPAVAVDVQAAVSLDLRHPLPGPRALVVGAARSGIAAARLLRRHGVEVTACDRRSEAQLTPAAPALPADGVTGVWGHDDASLLAGHDLVVWSPGLPFEHPLAAAARAAGV